jgi:hypothetical protein
LVAVENENEPIRFDTKLASCYATICRPGSG